MIFRNDTHGVLFEKEIRLHKGCGKKITAAFLYTENHSLGEWFQRRLLPMMKKEKLLLV